MMNKTTKTTRPGPLSSSDPTTWAVDPTRMVPDPTGRRADGGQRASFVSGMTFGASIAASVSAQGATAGGDTVTERAPNGLTASGLVSADNASASGSSVEFSSSRVNATATATVTATVTHCEHCGAEFVAHRPWARFCGAYCRRRAWLDRNPERAAELHERDIARLREHVIGNGGAWVEVR